jgi:hypothetical protein
MQTRKTGHIYNKAMIWSFWDSVLLSEIEWVWICVAFKIDNTNAYFDLSEVLCPMLFLSESLGRPSGYFQAECWFLAESSLHSWTKLQPTILERPQWLVKSRLMQLMHSLHGLQEKSIWSICDWGSRWKLGLQKAIEVATFSRDFNNSICCLSSLYSWLSRLLGQYLHFFKMLVCQGGSRNCYPSCSMQRGLCRIKSRPQVTVSPQCQSLDSLCSPKHHALFPGCILQH